jgi:hypothetical protein
MSETKFDPEELINFIENENHELFEIIQELCLVRMFLLKKKIIGITFLMPDEELMNKIKKLNNEDAEQLVPILQSLVLIMNLPNIRYFDKYINDIPTFLQKKLPIQKIEKNKVILENDAIITPNNNYNNKFAGPFSRYNSSGDFVPLNSNKSDFSNITKIKENTRNHHNEDSHEFSRHELFQHLFNNYKKNKRDPFLEVIISLYDWSEQNNKVELMKLIKEQTSYDTLASSHIIFQPYKEKNNVYLSDDEFNDWCNYQKYFKYYCDISKGNPINKYIQLIENNDNNDIIKHIYKNRKQAEETSSKPTIINTLNRYINDASKYVCNLRKTNYHESHLSLSETELRVISSIMHDNESELNEYQTMFSKKLKLDEPFYLTNKAMKSCNIGFYYSTAYLAIRSNGYLYMSGLANNIYKDNIDNIAVEGVNINLYKPFSEQFKEEKTLYKYYKKVCE